MHPVEKWLSELLGTTCRDIDQAMFRSALAVVVALYIAYFSYSGHIDGRDAVFLAAGVSVKIVVAVVIVIWTALVPDYRFSRRVAEFTLDRGGYTWLLCFGGPVTLPLYAMVLWITLGNGLRYGTNYLLAGVAAVFLGVILAWQVNPFWQAYPFVPSMLLFILVALPMYVLVLLRQIEDASKSARDANMAKSRMMAQASHDLRQPIHAISLYTACLRDAGLQPKELQVVDSIDRSLGQVQRLFKSLLDVSTLDSGRVTARREPVALGELVDDLMRQNGEPAQRAGIELRAVRCSLVVDVDRTLLTTMLQNVVSNCIKYAPGARVVIGCRRRGATASLYVYDDGPGIAPEHQSRVFEEFYQVRERGDRDIEGVGLGLPIVRRLADLLGLQVDLRSSPGRGTCVRISGLRVIPKPVRSGPPATVKLASSVQGLNILLVEDDDSVREATATLLQSWGCSVQAEATIPDQVEQCDLLITDYDLGGGVTGADCILAVRAMLGRDVAAVVMTGHDEAKVRAEITDDRIPVLSKPMRPAELRSIVLVRMFIAPGQDEALCCGALKPTQPGLR